MLTEEGEKMAENNRALTETTEQLNLTNKQVR